MPQGRSQPSLNYMANPPATSMSTPVIYELESDAKKQYRSAISTVSPNLPIGVIIRTICLMCGGIASAIGVLMKPGTTVLHLTPAKQPF